MYTVAQYVNYWLDLRKADLAHSTHSRYRVLARRQIFPHIGGLQLGSLTPARLQRLYADLTKAGSATGKPLCSGTVEQVHRFLHVCLSRAANDGLVDSNPAAEVSTPDVALKRRI